MCTHMAHFQQLLSKLLSAVENAEYLEILFHQYRITEQQLIICLADLFGSCRLQIQQHLVARGQIVAEFTLNVVAAVDQISNADIAKHVNRFNGPATFSPIDQTIRLNEIFENTTQNRAIILERLSESLENRLKKSLSL